MAAADTRAMQRNSTTFNTSTGIIRTQVVQIQADGTNPVVVDMQQSGLRGINAFDLEALPPPITLRVDFGAPNHNRQDGFLAFDATDNSGSSQERTQNYIAGFGQGNTMRAELSMNVADSAKRAIHRGTPHNHALGDLAASWIGPDEGNLVLTLHDLLAGTYDMLSYHHDTTQTGTFDVLVDGVLTLSGLTVSTGNLSPGDPITTAAFSFTADGLNPVEITYQLTGSRFMIMNGFELTGPPPAEAVIPEPSTALLGLVGVAFLLRRRQRRG